MGFFNEKQVKAFKTGMAESLFISDFKKYKDFQPICGKCGAKIEFEDEW